MSDVRVLTDNGSSSASAKICQRSCAPMAGVRATGRSLPCVAGAQGSSSVTRIAGFDDASKAAEKFPTRTPASLIGGCWREDRGSWEKASAPYSPVPMPSRPRLFDACPQGAPRSSSSRGAAASHVHSPTWTCASLCHPSAAGELASTGHPRPSSVQLGPGCGKDWCGLSWWRSRARSILQHRRTRNALRRCYNAMFLSYVFFYNYYSSVIDSVAVIFWKTRGGPASWGDLLSLLSLA